MYDRRFFSFAVSRFLNSFVKSLFAFFVASNRLFSSSRRFLSLKSSSFSCFSLSIFFSFSAIVLSNSPYTDYLFKNLLTKVWVSLVPVAILMFLNAVSTTENLLISLSILFFSRRLKNLWTTSRFLQFFSLSSLSCIALSAIYRISLFLVWLTTLTSSMLSSWLRRLCKWSYRLLFSASNLAISCKLTNLARSFPSTMLVSSISLKLDCFFRCFNCCSAWNFL